MNWNEFQKENSWKNYAFYDPPVPDRPLIQMKNQQGGEKTKLSNGPVMATHVQAWGRQGRSETNDNTRIT